MNNGSDEAATMELKDTILLINRQIRKIIKLEMAELMAKAIKTPSPVATPLPPLNFTQKEKLCPKRAENEDINIVVGVLNIWATIKTAAIPFNTSVHRVMAKGAKPKVR